MIARALAAAVLVFCAACSSPTAPTESYRLIWTPALGCAPSLPIPTPNGAAVAVVLIGTQAIGVWPSDQGPITVTFNQVGPAYMVCAWTKGAGL